MNWPALLKSLPGYDPFATADGCWFDEKAAQLALDFFEDEQDGCLRHVEGALAGQRFRLEDWQRAFLGNLFGWKRTDGTGRTVRRYREALLYVPRKNGKTPLVAGLALFTLFCDGEAGAQCYVAAGDREQAGMLFRQARGMVEQDGALEARCRIYGGTAAGGQSRSIVCEDVGSYLRVISADANTKHGGNTHLAVIDELHVQRDRDLYDVLRTSMASQNRPQPLLVCVTTADFMRDSLCNSVYDYACKVRDGVIKDPTFLPCIYEAAKDEPWDDPATWRKANPNLGVSVSLDYMAAECAKAKEVPAQENAYRRLHLNQRTEQDVRAIPMDKWRACSQVSDPVKWRAATLNAFARRTCFGGLDLGSTSDLCALALLFPPECHAERMADLTERWTVLPFFWVPRETARQRARRDRVDYPLWIKQGFIFETEGDVTDYAKVRLDVGKLADEYGIQELAVDRVFQGAQLCTELMADGLDVIAFGQGFLSMAAPVKRLLELIVSGELEHGNNPVLTWMAANAASEIDPAGNQKFSKKKSTEKIDGMVALAMALGRAMVEPVATDGGFEAW
jgi:phage terminase large subunit-like protein